VPATQPRQRKRRFPERELLERLKKYETIMRQNNVKFDAMHNETNNTEKSSPTDYYSDHEQGDDESSRARSEETNEAKYETLIGDFGTL
jgi:hypothetical protein